MAYKILFNNDKLQLDEFADGSYRITLFNEDNHWSGEIMFNEDEVLYDNLSEDKVIDNEELERLAWEYAPNTHTDTDYGECDYNEESREAFKEGYKAGFYNNL